MLRLQGRGNNKGRNQLMKRQKTILENSPTSG